MIRLCENIYYDEKDIYYNRDKFERGDTNLCFVIGHSGSGKSTMASRLAELDDSLQICEMDKLYYILWNEIDFSKEEMGTLFDVFMQGEGKRLSQLTSYVDMNDPYPFWVRCLASFFRFAMDYADCHKDQRFVIEGVQPLEFNPREFKDYAVYILGSSLINSKLKQAKRDRRKDLNAGHYVHNSYMNYLFDGWEYFEKDEIKLQKFRNYFAPLVNGSLL